MGAETKKYFQETGGQKSKVKVINKRFVRKLAPATHMKGLTPCDSEGNWGAYQPPEAFMEGNSWTWWYFLTPTEKV